MKLLELYTSLLKVANLSVSEDGFVSTNFNGKTAPTMVDGKRLVLPTPAHLARTAGNSEIIFHPLSENMMRDSSIILDAYRTAINSRIHYTVGMLMSELLIIASSPGLHANLSPDQSEFLNKVKNADDKTVEVFNKLLIKMAESQQKDVIVNVYIKRGGYLGDKKFQRVGIVTFPFYQELLKGEDVYGVKLRVKDRETIIKLLEYVFPQIADPEAYNVGINAKLAPNIEALMKVIIGIGSLINDQISLFGSLMDNPDEMMIEAEWVSTFENLDVMRPELLLIPMQAGNEGTIPGITTAPGTAQAPVAPQNVIQAAPPPPVYQPQQPVYQQPQYQQPAPPPIVQTPNGLDFTSLAARNPNLQPQQPQYPYNNMMVNNQQQNRTPGWAQPQQMQYVPQPQPMMQNPIYQNQNNQQWQQPQQQFHQPQQQNWQQPQGHITF
jgi:hypothetical protein